MTGWLFWSLRLPARASLNNPTSFVDLASSLIKTSNKLPLNIKIVLSLLSNSTLTSYARISRFICITSMEDIMRTTLDLPDDLVVKAMEATNIKTKTKVIITALEQLIRKSTISEIKNYQGQVDLEIDLNVIRGRKCPL